MWQDEIVEQTRLAREAYAAQFGYDLAAIYRDLQEKERQSQQPVVSLAPQRPVRVTIQSVESMAD
ncbi:MAG: hypothetical protein HY870_06025 [Chloroflexi bacterium]|nr:hypothetical protein [Chloroflexota bacterium]